MHARDRALLLLAVRRGLIGPEAASRAQGLARPDASLSNSLVGSRLLRVRDAEALEAEIDRLAWSCGRCPPVPGSQLARLPALECPRCQQVLRPSPPDSGRLPAAPSSSPLRPSELARPSGRLAGRRVGPYRLERELGRGSWGAVYLAQREGREEPCALKLLRDPLGADGEVLARFEREAQLPRQLEHPGIVRVLETGQHQGFPYYAMAYCAGEDLKSKLERRPLAPAEACDLVARIADALAYAHQRGVLHRDLKPGNVLLREGTGEPVITDFGFAKVCSLSASLTRSGATFGTLYYMAPEQYKDSKHVGPAADVFALGVILYEALTGQRPFQGAGPTQVAEALLRHDPPPPSKHAPGVSAELDALIARTIAKQPDERPSAEALAEALRALGGAPAPAAAAPAPRGTALALGGIGLLLAISGGVVALALVRADRAPAPQPAIEEAAARSPESPAPVSPAADVDDLLRAARAAARSREPYEAVDAVLADAAFAAGDDASARARVAIERLGLAWRRAHFAEVVRQTDALLGDAGISQSMVRLLRARALVQTGRNEEGLALYRGLVGQPPRGDAWLLCAQGEVRALQGQHDPRPAEEVLGNNPDHVDALILRARSILRQRPEEAVRNLERAAELAPDSMHVYFWWGLADASLRDWAAKAAHLKTAIELCAPRPHVTALLWRGHTLWLLRRYQEAEVDLDRLLEQNPRDLEALVWRAGCWYAMGQEERAREAWRELDRTRGQELRELLQRGGRRVEVRNLQRWIVEAIGP